MAWARVEHAFNVQGVGAPVELTSSPPDATMPSKDVSRVPLLAWSSRVVAPMEIASLCLDDDHVDRT